MHLLSAYFRFHFAFVCYEDMSYVASLQHHAKHARCRFEPYHGMLGCDLSSSHPFEGTLKP